MNFPDALLQKLQLRAQTVSLRKLPEIDQVVDFCSNDYLGLAKSQEIHSQTLKLLQDFNLLNGSTASRLIAGNHSLYNIAEKNIASFHNFESATIFNSGYDANIGFWDAIPQKNDVVIYDEFCHASIRDGLRLSYAKSFKFKHNNLVELRSKIEKLRFQNSKNEIYIATESVFSMDGDIAPLKEIADISNEFNCRLVVDEAHGVGVLGKYGAGLVSDLELNNQVFAVIVTFGKALGCHGAAILGCNNLKTYLINFARSLIYTTALPPHSVATIISAYGSLSTKDVNYARLSLENNIQNYLKLITALDSNFEFSKNTTSIQTVKIPGNENVRIYADVLRKKGFDVKAILAPTVPKGSERIRICLHSFNTKQQIENLISSINI